MFRTRPETIILNTFASHYRGYLSVWNHEKCSILNTKCGSQANKSSEQVALLAAVWTKKRFDLLESVTGGL